MEPLPNYVQDYLRDLKLKQRQPSTIRRYRYDLIDFFHWLSLEVPGEGSQLFLSLPLEKLEQYIDILSRERKYQIRTLKRVVTVLNQQYRYAIKKGLTDANPVEQLIIPELTTTTLTNEDILNSYETTKLKRTIGSSTGLSERQIKAHHFLKERNLSIILLFLHYGLSLKEVISLRMHHIHFESNTVDVSSVISYSRTILLAEDDKKQLYSYYQSIPSAVRPAYHSNDPFFIAFDFQRCTYRWVYELEQPKALTEIALQKMLRQEIKRSGLRKGISAQHLRHTFVITKLQEGTPIDLLKETLGLKSSLSMKKYVEYLKVNPTQ